MAGVERGGIFAFVVLTIALSVTVTLVLALMFFKPRADQYEETMRENRELVRKYNLVLERNEMLETGAKKQQPNKEEKKNDDDSKEERGE